VEWKKFSLFKLKTHNLVWNKYEVCFDYLVLLLKFSDVVELFFPKAVSRTLNPVLWISLKNAVQNLINFILSIFFFTSGIPQKMWNSSIVSVSFVAIRRVQINLCKKLLLLIHNTNINNTVIVVVTYKGIECPHIKHPQVRIPCNIWDSKLTSIEGQEGWIKVEVWKWSKETRIGFVIWHTIIDYILRKNCTKD